MAVVNINTIKNWFKTGMIPTQAQFWSVFDSYRHKNDNIPVAEVEGINELLATRASQQVLDNHLAQKGAPGGYAPLDEFTKLAAQYLNIVNDLVTGGATALLSAEQGKVLQTQVNAINTLLTSDNVNLDTVQELVDAIETVQISLSTILVNDLTTGGTTKALTAEMGKLLAVEVSKIPYIEREGAKGIEFVAGVIRNTGGVWHFISDDDHFGASNIFSLTTNEYNVSVNYKKEYGKILTFIATPDETYVKNGINCGSSVGLGFAEIFLKQSLAIGDYIFFDGANWVSFEGRFSSFSYLDGILTVGHTEKMYYYDLSLTARDSSDFDLRLGTIGFNYIQIKFYNRDNSQYTGVPTVGMKFFLSRRSDKVLSNAEAEFPTANIWIIGIMQTI